jgi:transcriptional regulator
LNEINDKRKLSTGCVKDFETLRDRGGAKGPATPARGSFADDPRVAMVYFRPYVAKEVKSEAVSNVYIPPHFEEVRGDAIAETLEHAPLACVVASTDMGLIANHLPLLRSPKGDLVGHVALANDMHRLIADGQEVLAVFRRDDAYVSPNFYPTKQDHHRHVPTWNYEVVHAYGTITFQHDEHAKRAAVGLLTRNHERRLNGANAWRMADAPTDYMDKMLDGIVAFRIAVTQILAKSKLSQNREARDYLGAIEGLRASGHGDMADRMSSRVDRDH